MNGGRIALVAAGAPLPVLLLLLLTPLGTAIFAHDEFHVALIAVATVVAAVVGVLAIGVFQAHGRVRDLALAGSFLSFAAIYAWHGVYTGTEPAFRWLIYGPPSRLAFGIGMLGVTSARRVSRQARNWASAALALGVTGLALFSWALAPAVANWAAQQSASTLAVTRLSIEGTGALFVCVATARLAAGVRRGVPLLVVAGAAIIAEQSFFFILAKPWDAVWWGAHALGAAGTTTLAVGVLVVVRRAHAEAEIGWIRREADVRQLFLNNAAHALRTPLTPLTLQLHILSKQLADHPAAPAVEQATKATRRLTSIVDELLVAAEAGAQPSRGSGLRSVDLAALANEVASEKEGLANQKGLQLLVDTKPCKVAGDEAKVRKILQNVLDNAIQYTPTGHVVVTVRRTTTGGSIAVRDTGIGIDPSDLDLIFMPFGQLGGAGQQATKSSGLSLAVCRVIAASHGGTMTAHSDGLGTGTTVTLNLPRDPSEATW